MENENRGKTPVAGQADERDRGTGTSNDGEPDDVVLDDERARPEHDRSPLT